MADIRGFIESQLIEPLKLYPTVIQDTMIEIIIDRLESLYYYTIKFPEIVTPGSQRLDIVKAIADQFLFTIREEADLEEQLNILDNILYVYSRRGSIDTIENMWKYYGGGLPKDVKVVIPSYNLFRYSISKFSGTHVFTNDPDYTHQGSSYRTGAYEIQLINNTYPIPKLKEFLIEELVAAGNSIYFTNTLHMEILGYNPLSSPYRYDVYERDIIYKQLSSIYSATPPSIIADLTILVGSDILAMNTYSLYENYGVSVSASTVSFVRYGINIRDLTEYAIQHLLNCTAMSSSLFISRNLYNNQGELIDINYPGYFILGSTLLGEEVI